MFSKWLDKEFSKEQNSLRISVDVHCCGGALLKSQNNKFNIDSLNLSRNHTVPIKTTKELFSKTFQGTLKDYLNETYEFEAFTYENKSMSNNKINIISLIENLILEYKKA